MGIAVIGGLFTSTLLTLFVVPTAYITFDGCMRNFNKLVDAITGRKKSNEGTQRVVLTKAVAEDQDKENR